MESPQISSCRNNVRASAGSDTAATHSAPNVDNGDTSTMAAPTLMLSATASGSPPPTFSTRPGTVGRNAGSTTPAVLLQLEINPVTNATTPFSDAGLARRASIDVNSSMPPVFSSTEISTVTPQTMTMTPHGTRFMASDSSATRISTSTDAARNAANPTLSWNPTTPTIHAPITAIVSQCLCSKRSTSASRASGARAGSFHPPNTTYAPAITST